MTTCSQLTNDRLFDLFDGRLPAEEDASMREHLRSCTACRERVMSIESLREVLAAGAPAPESLGLERRARILEAANRMLKPRASRRSRLGRMSSRRAADGMSATRGAYLAVAAAVLLAAGVGLVVMRGRDRPQSTAARPRAERSQPRAVDQARGIAAQDAGPEAAAAGSEAPRPVDVPSATLAGRPEPAGSPAAIPAPPPRPAPLSEVELAEAPQATTPAAAPDALLAPADEPRTDRAIARIGLTEGLVMYKRGAQGKWAKALPGVRLLAGDHLDTRTGMARIDLVSDPAGGGAARASVCANRQTIVQLLWARTETGAEVPLLSLSRGEVYVEDEQLRVHVETPDGLFSPVGTSFDVKIKRAAGATIVVVGEGAIEARARKKGTRGQPKPETVFRTSVDLRGRTWAGEAVRIGAGQQLSVRQGAAPSAPQPAARTRFAWLARLAPWLSFAGRLGGPLLYSMESPRGKIVPLRLPGAGEAQTLEGWTYPMGRPWAVRSVPATQIASRRWKPAGPAAVRRHATVGQATWQDYEVVLAFRVRSGSASSRNHSVYAIAYHGAGARDLYRLGVWHVDAARAWILLVSNHGAATKIYAERTVPFAVRSGEWYRMRYAVRTLADRVEMRGKVWLAARREPNAWTIQAEDRSPKRLRAGHAGVGLHNVVAEIAEFGVHKLVGR